MSPLLLLAAFFADLTLGDPRSWPHPVIIIGRLIDGLTGPARKHLRPGWGLKLAGAAIVAVVVGLTWVVAALLLLGAERLGPPVAAAVGVYLAYTTLSVRGLYDHTWRVAAALKENDLERARQLLSLVVGRDTSRLDRAGVLRAVLETVAENLSDGIVAPLFYLALGGPALGLAFKAVNTLDSMIGYKDERFRDLGWAAARLDDLAGLIPARLSAFMIALAAWLLKLDGRGAVRTWLAEGGRHSSPNAGRPEAALAGALGVRLGGPGVYHGELVVKPYIGSAGGPLTIRHAHQAEKIMLTASILTLAAAAASRALW